jgi:hypothetical protein
MFVPQFTEACPPSVIVEIIKTLKGSLFFRSRKWEGDPGRKRKKEMRKGLRAWLKWKDTDQRKNTK